MSPSLWTTIFPAPRSFKFWATLRPYPIGVSKGCVKWCDTSIAKFVFVLFLSLYAPEIKFYSNKVIINEQFETNIKGLYSIGDGGGMTRGLMMASCSGIQMARNL